MIRPDERFALISHRLIDKFADLPELCREVRKNVLSEPYYKRNPAARVLQNVEREFVYFTWQHIIMHDEKVLKYDIRDELLDQLYIKLTVKKRTPCEAQMRKKKILQEVLSFFRKFYSLE